MSRPVSQVLTPLPLGRLGIVSFRSQIHRFALKRRTYAGIAEFTTGSDSSDTPYWRHIGPWKDVSEKDFLSYRWQVRHTIDREEKLFGFLAGVLPPQIPRSAVDGSGTLNINFMTRDEFLEDVHEGMKAAPMSVRLTPHVLSAVDWTNPIKDPIRRQFVPLQSAIKPDHPALSLDSLCEKDHSPVPGLVHRYPDKVLFLGHNVRLPRILPLLHTIVRRAAHYLFQRGAIVRNQSVLLKGVNDDAHTMGALIRKLADLNIQPYYVYQSDMVRGVEELRTPLSTILKLERDIRGTIAGFMMPSFIVDLPGGGGKRLAHSYESYDERTGVSTWKAPGISGDEVFTYHDPIEEARV